MNLSTPEFLDTDKKANLILNDVGEVEKSKVRNPWSISVQSQARYRTLWHPPLSSWNSLTEETTNALCEAVLNDTRRSSSRLSLGNNQQGVVRDPRYFVGYGKKISRFGSCVGNN